MAEPDTKERIQVMDDEDAWPYIEVRLDQLEFVKKLLDDAGYRYSVDRDAISINGQPFTLTIAFEPRADVAAIQRLFDNNEATKTRRPRRSRSSRRG